MQLEMQLEGYALLSKLAAAVVLEYRKQQIELTRSQSHSLDRYMHSMYDLSPHLSQQRAVSVEVERTISRLASV